MQHQWNLACRFPCTCTFPPSSLFCNSSCIYCLYSHRLGSIPEEKHHMSHRVVLEKFPVRIKWLSYLMSENDTIGKPVGSDSKMWGQKWNSQLGRTWPSRCGFLEVWQSLSPSSELHPLDLLGIPEGICNMDTHLIAIWVTLWSSYEHMLWLTDINCVPKERYLVIFSETKSGMELQILEVWGHLGV